MMDLTDPRKIGPQPALGRAVAVDERDERFPLRSVPAGQGRASKYWLSRGKKLDQGMTSQCVGYSAFRYLTTHPIVNAQPHLTPEQLYRLAQRVDEWPGEEPTYEGTSVRAVMKVLKREGYISEYRWARDAEAVMAHLLTIGPVLMGTTWTRDMFMPDRWGFITDSGPPEGGHAYLLVGGNRHKPCPDGTVGAVRVINSWGDGWGDKGRAWMSLATLRRLIDDWGEACVATEIKRAA